MKRWFEDFIFAMIFWAVVLYMLFGAILQESYKLCPERNETWYQWRPVPREVTSSKTSAFVFKRGDGIKEVSIK